VENQGISDILDKLGKASDGERVSVEDVFAAFGRRSYGPILFVIGILSASPLGSIPGASIVFGSLTIVLMGQFLVRSGTPWIPDWIEHRSVGAKRFRSALEKIRPTLGRIDKVIGPRMTALAQPPWSKALAVLAIVLALTMYPLALVPWGVLPPSLALALIGLGLAAGDGLLLLLAWGASLASLACLYYLL